MEKNEIMRLIAGTFTAGAGVVVIAQKSADKKMRKGTKNNRNPYLGGRVEIRKEYRGYVLGTDYKQTIENVAGRLGNEDADANLKKVWHTPTEFLGQWFSTDKKTMTKVYLKLGYNRNKVAVSTETYLYLDGCLLSPDSDTYKDIKSWWNKESHTMSSTQIELGIDKAHEQVFLLPQLDTIISIEQGDKTIYPSALLHEHPAYVPAYSL